MQYGSIPMQTNHFKQNYAAYLSKNFPKVILLKSFNSCRPQLLISLDLTIFFF